MFKFDIRKVCDLVRGRNFSMSIILVFSSISSSFAATGFTLNGSCFATPEDALNSYVQSFPQISGGVVLNLASSAINASTIAYTVNSTTLETGVINTVSGSINLQTCDHDIQGWKEVEVSSLVFYSALVILFFIGLRMGFLL